MAGSDSDLKNSDGEFVSDTSFSFSDLKSLNTSYPRFFATYGSGTLAILVIGKTIMWINCNDVRDLADNSWENKKFTEVFGRGLIVK